MVSFAEGDRLPLDKIKFKILKDEKGMVSSTIMPTARVLLETAAESSTYMFCSPSSTGCDRQGPVRRQESRRLCCARVSKPIAVYTLFAEHNELTYALLHGSCLQGIYSYLLMPARAR